MPQTTKRHSLPWLPADHEQKFRDAYKQAVADDVTTFVFNINGTDHPFDRQYAYYAIEFLDMKP